MKKLNRLSHLTLAALMLVLACNRLANVLAPNEWVWRLHDVTMSAGAITATLLAFLLMPYEHLRPKCILAAITSVFLVDFICVATGSGGYWYWIIAQIIAGFASVAFYLRRTHNESADDLLHSNIYCLRAIPRAPQDFVISLFGLYGSDGGYSLFAEGFIYRYRQGVLIKQAITNLPPGRYHVAKGATITPEIIAELDSLVGRRWSLRHNCLTVLGPVWRRYSG